MVDSNNIDNNALGIIQEDERKAKLLKKAFAEITAFYEKSQFTLPKER
jgi:hypothetical protein